MRIDLRHALERLMAKLCTDDGHKVAIDELLPDVEAAFTGTSFWAPFLHSPSIPRLSEWLNTTGRVGSSRTSSAGADSAPAASRTRR